MMRASAQRPHVYYDADCREWWSAEDAPIFFVVFPPPGQSSEPVRIDECAPRAFVATNSAYQNYAGPWWTRAEASDHARRVSP